MFCNRPICSAPLLTLSGVVTQPPPDVPAPEIPDQTTGGGWLPDYVARKTSVREERERLGIFPKAAKKIIKAVAKKAEEAEKTDYQAQALLQAALERQDMAYRQQYAAALEQERQRIQRDREDKIHRALMLRKKLEDDEDEYEVELLLM